MQHFTCTEAYTKNQACRNVLTSRTDFFVITICPNVMKKYFNTMKISKLLKLLKIFAFSVVNVNDEYMKPWFKRRCRS